MSAADWRSAGRQLDRLEQAGELWPAPATAMEVLGVAGIETRHRRMIAWLLDPRGTHGLGPALLARLLRRCGRPDLAGSAALADAEVDQEADLPGTAEAAHRRADIVVRVAGMAVVIELKIHSHEHQDQTRDLARHFAYAHRPLLVFLTLTGEPAGHPGFLPVRLADLATDLRSCLEPVPATGHGDGALGQATAWDYLRTLERKTGVTSAEAMARFWITHGHRLEWQLARRAAFDLMGRLPGLVAEELGRAVRELRVTTTVYTATGTQEYTERAVLLTTPAWSDGQTVPLAGVGFGMREGLKPSEDRMTWGNRPFCGIWLADRALHTGWPRSMSDNSWAHWSDWEYLDLTAEDDEPDLVALYARRAADRVQKLWEAHFRALDAALGSTAQS